MLKYKQMQKAPGRTSRKTVLISTAAALLLSAVIFVSPSSAQEDQGAGTILSSLRDAIALSLKNNLNIQIQEKETDVSRAGVMLSRSALLPQVNLNGSYTKNDKVLEETIFTGYKNDNQLGLTLTQSLYSGGGNIAALKQARAGLRIQEETLKQEKLNVEFETKRLYYGLLLAYETERIAQDLFDQAEAHYKDVLAKFKEGTASKFDCLQSKVQVSKIMPELVRAKNAVELIKADLKKLLRLKMTEGLKVNDRLDYLPITIDEPEFLKTAYLNQPAMTIKELGIDFNKWAVRVARASNLPQVNASLDYEHRSNNLNTLLNSRQSNFSAGFSVSVPLFDGFSSKAKVDAAKARYQEAFLSKDDMSDQIAVDIKKACLDLRQSQAIIDYTKDNVGEAREALRISEVNYDNGMGTNLDVLDSQVSLSQIEKDLANGIYDYLMAQAFLDQTMGKLIQ
ncbi:MAG: TolC family protein [Candidatus Omnitrophica bacterium]|nr:TolC family protein [Candidatus Omnitrophota bacterium]